VILKFKTVKGHSGDVRVLSYIQAGAEQAAPMFSNMAGGSVQELIREVAALRSLRPKLNKAGAHLIMSHDPSQRALTEAEWREALDIALAAHGAEGCPYAAWLHTEKEHIHLHVYLLRIRPDGNVVSDSNSYRKNERASRAIEAHLGLDAPKPRAPEDRHPRDGGARVERGRRRFERLTAAQTSTDQPTQKGKRMIDPSIIFSTIDEATDLDDLKERMLKKGIECQFVQAPGSAEPTGWSLRQVGPSGTWIKGSDVSRDLSLKKVQERMQERARQRQAQAEERKEQLMEMMDELGVSLQDRADQIGDEAAENHRVFMEQRQKGLAQLIAGLAVHSVRVAIGGLFNGFASLIERLLGLPRGSLGRIQVPEFESTVDVPVGVVPPAPPRHGASEGERKRLALGQRLMGKVIDQTAEAIELGKPEKLPGLGLKKSPEIQEARAQVLKAIEESRKDDDDQDDDEPHEQERPR
jgi:hypothetical protein